jgi:cytochrome P450
LSPLLAAPLVLPAVYWGSLKAINGRRRQGEPPLVTCSIPFLGTGVSFGKDALEFLTQCRAKHGDVFTLYLAGKRMTFVLDPKSYNAVLTPKNMSFHVVVDEVVTNALSYPKVRERLPIEKLERIGRDLLKGAPLQRVGERMQASLAREIQTRLDPDWQEVGLYQWVREIIFMGATEAVFGSGVANKEALRLFTLFDKHFPMMAGGVPPRLLKEGFDAVAALGSHLSENGPDASEWMVERRNLLESLSELDRGRFQAAIMWAIQGNTMPAAFWACSFILHSPGAQEAILDEIRGVAGNLDEGLPELPVSEINKLKLLESAIREAMRLRTGSMTLRGVLEDTSIETESGTWKVREGDRVCLVPFVTHHDADIFEAPFEYRHERFYDPGGVKQFYKDGKRLPLALMLFGSGASMCPGRFLAMHEIKLMVAYMLIAFECEPLEPTPTFDVSRAGVGVFPPVSEMKVRIRARSSEKHT